ncbi:MAG: hypothetical protein ACKOX6_13715 [Bdellovibrio sp.]
MLKRIANLKVTLSLLVLVGSLNAAAAPKYPSVLEWQGGVSLTGKDGKKVQVKGKIPLQEQALFETSDEGSVKVAIDAERSFIILPHSVVSLPTISWEGGEAPLIILKSGSLRWQQASKDKVAYNAALSSDLFQFIPPVGDFIFEMNPAKAYAEVKVLKGVIEFSALNGDEFAQVKAGHQVGFQGMVEGKEIAYDVLLQGRKIPRGRLTPVTAISAKELASFDGAEKKQKKAASLRRSKEMAARDSEGKSGAICAKPAGRFNECVWQKVGKSDGACQRRRCNANGVWAEETTVDAQKPGTNCKAQPVVAPCDY